MLNQTSLVMKQLVGDIERDLLSRIILDLRHKKMSAGEAQYLARDFLALLPSGDEEELLEKFGELGKTYPEVQKIYIKYVGPLKEKQRRKALEIIRDFIAVYGGKSWKKI